MAAGPVSKSKIISQIAEDAEVSKKTAAKMLDSLSSMAHREAIGHFNRGLASLGSLPETPERGMRSTSPERVPTQASTSAGPAAPLTTISAASRRSASPMVSSARSSASRSK